MSVNGAGSTLPQYDCEHIYDNQVSTDDMRVFLDKPSARFGVDRIESLERYQWLISPPYPPPSVNEGNAAADNDNYNNNEVNDDDSKVALTSRCARLCLLEERMSPSLELLSAFLGR